MEMPGVVGTWGLPTSSNWESLADPTNLNKWGWDEKSLLSNLILDGYEYESKLDPETNKLTIAPKVGSVSPWDALERPTPLDVVKRITAPGIGYWLSGKMENIQDMDRVSAIAKRASAERVLNTPDRLLSAYMLGQLLGPEQNDQSKELSKMQEYFKSLPDLIKQTVASTIYSDYLPQLIQNNLDGGNPRSRIGYTPQHPRYGGQRTLPDYS